MEKMEIAKERRSNNSNNDMKTKVKKNVIFDDGGGNSGSDGDVAIECIEMYHYASYINCLAVCVQKSNRHTKTKRKEKKRDIS